MGEPPSCSGGGISAAQKSHPVRELPFTRRVEVSDDSFVEEASLCAAPILLCVPMCMELCANALPSIQTKEAFPLTSRGEGGNPLSCRNTLHAHSESQSLFKFRGILLHA